MLCLLYLRLPNCSVCSVQRRSLCATQFCSVDLLSAALLSLCSAVFSLLSAVLCSALCSAPCCLLCCLLCSALCSLPSALCPLLSALCSLPSALCPLLSALLYFFCSALLGSARFGPYCTVLRSLRQYGTTRYDYFGTGILYIIFSFFDLM
jgi:hypothetical protein